MTAINIDMLKKLPLFQNCSEETLVRIASGAAIEHGKKGKVLFLNGDAADSFFLLTKGWIKLFRETLDGDQAIIDILPQGHLFGETAIFEDGTYAYSTEVIEDAEYVRMPLKILRQEIETNNHLAVNMLKTMSRYRRDQEMEIEHRTLQSAPQRIGCFLLRLIDQHNTGPVSIHLPYDKTLLAARLGMQPETFSRALARLKDETGIVIRGSTIEAESYEQLSAFSCSACSSGFPCSDK